jgi:hypothetical protein
MTSRTSAIRSATTLFAALIAAPLIASGQSPAAVAAFNSYVAALEARLAQQHRTPAQFLAPVSPQSQPVNHQTILEELTPTGGRSLPGALLHDWRGTAFVPGATAADFERLLKDFNNYPQHFAPQVLRAKVLADHGDRLQASMRLSQHHLITVVIDSTYDVTFARLDAQHGYSRSQSIAIAEIGSPGTPTEHALSAAEEHGFLWRLNTYWTYEERDGGLAVQIESISLTRSIPTGLGWAIRPFVESVPRDSLQFTLQSVCNALGK